MPNPAKSQPKVPSKIGPGVVLGRRFSQVVDPDMLVLVFILAQRVP